MIFLIRIHAFCMGLLSVKNEHISDIAMELYSTILNKDTSLMYMKYNLEYFIKEFNFQYGKYSASKPTTLYALNISSIKIEPIFEMLIYANRNENCSILINSLNVTKNIFKLSTSEILSPYMLKIIGSLIRLLTRNISWDIKFLSFDTIKSLLQITKNCHNHLHLHILAPQLISVFVRLISNAPPSWPDKKQLCDEIISLQHLPFNISELIKIIVEKNYQDNSITIS
ncbi:LOW QUALITY PROTEIN: hypothetical protein HZS_3494 [Henneguya salminicola]|nr:LOW QUALITY PROTEIN: hypothetical protein HZS_3494 [Henneguya salminicola]